MDTQGIGGRKTECPVVMVVPNYLELYLGMLNFDHLFLSGLVSSACKLSFFLMQADNSRNRVLTALMTGMRDGQLKGILGRLGDLGAIPAKYDVAVSTACGALDHIVVESMEKAQAAVEFLKKNNLGQASFIGSCFLTPLEYFANIHSAKDTSSCFVLSQ